MSDAPVISVRGEALVEADPEIARLNVQVQAMDEDRRRTLDQLVERNQRCLDLIKSYGRAVEKVETGALTITPVLRHRRREGEIRHYQGTVWIKIVVSDFTVLGELVTRLGDQERTAVEGPHWELRRDSEVYDRAAKQAAQEAIVRARSYADALGCRLTGLLELSDEGLTAHGGGRAEMGYDGKVFAMARTMEGAEPGEPEPIDLEPETQTVRAAVEARFTASAPDFG